MNFSSSFLFCLIIISLFLFAFGCAGQANAQAGAQNNQAAGAEANTNGNAATNANANQAPANANSASANPTNGAAATGAGGAPTNAVAEAVNKTANEIAASAAAAAKSKNSAIAPATGEPATNVGSGAIATNTAIAATSTGGAITINTSVKINGASALPAATSGQNYNTKITVSGGFPPYNCTAAPGTILPGTLVFSEPGCSLVGGAPILAYGTPTAIYPIQILVKDSHGNIGGPFALYLVVNQISPKLILPEQIDAATVGSSYEYDFCPSAQGQAPCGTLPAFSSGTPPFTFTVSGQPMGISMKTDGFLSGTVPEGAILGNYKLTVCVTDLTGTEKCANTNMQVVQRQEPAQANSACPGEGNWKGTVIANGIMDVAGKPGQSVPYSINYDLEMTIKCDSTDVDENGARWWYYNITSVKASDPFFGCTSGCTPIAGTFTDRLSYLDLTEGSAKGLFMIHFPNNALLQRTNTAISSDSATITDDVKPQEAMGIPAGSTDTSIMATDSVGWNQQTGAKVEVPGCSSACPNTYPQRETVRLTKTG